MYTRIPLHIVVQYKINSFIYKFLSTSSSVSSVGNQVIQQLHHRYMQFFFLFTFYEKIIFLPSNVCNLVYNITMSTVIMILSLMDIMSLFFSHMRVKKSNPVYLLVWPWSCCCCCGFLKPVQRKRFSGRQQCFARAGEF